MNFVLVAFSIPHTATASPPPLYHIVSQCFQTTGKNVTSPPWDFSRSIEKLFKHAMADIHQPFATVSWNN